MPLTGRRFAATVGILAAAGALACLLSLFAGAVFIPPGEVVSALWGNGEEAVKAAVALRGMRTVSAFVTGSALGAAGALFQTVLRNPLADPYILGVSGGAGVGAVAAALAVPAGMAAGAASVAAPAALGALGAVWLLLELDRRRPDLGREGVLLLGVMLNAVCGALTIAAVSLMRGEEIMAFFRWMLGSFSSPRMGLAEAAGAAGVTAGLIAWSASNGRALNLLMLGEDEAKSMGLSAGRTRRAATAAGGLLAACAVSVAGLVGFVGLVAPHAARKTGGGDMRLLPLSSALLGGALLTLCDSLARTVSRPSELPVGVVTALIGAPVFAAMLLGRNKGRTC